MKTLKILLLLLLVACRETPLDKIIPVHTEEGVAYFDTVKKKFVNNDRYEAASEFSDGLASVKFKNEKMYGYINKKFTKVIEPKFLSAAPFKNGKAFVQDESGDQYYIDSEGKELSPEKYPYNVCESKQPIQIFDCSKKNFWKQGDDYRLTIANSELKGKGDHKLTEITYYLVKCNSNENMEYVSKNSFFELIGFQPCIYNNFFPNPSGILNIKNGNIIDKTKGANNFNFTLSMSPGNNFNGKYLLVDNRKDRNSSIIDYEGTVVSIFPWDQYKKKLPFSDDMLGYEDNGLIGYLNEKSEIAIEPRFTNASIFQDGLARVTEGDKIGFIDKKGSWIIGPFNENETSILQDFSQELDGLVLVNGNYIDKSGNVFLIDGNKFSIEKVDNVSSSVLENREIVESLLPFRKFSQAGKCGLISKDRNFIVPAKFTHCLPFINANFVYDSTNSKFSILGNKGEVIASETFNLDSSSPLNLQFQGAFSEVITIDNENSIVFAIILKTNKIITIPEKITPWYGAISFYTHYFTISSKDRSKLLYYNYSGELLYKK